MFISGLAFGVLFSFVFSQYLTDVSCSLSSVLVRNERLSAGVRESNPHFGLSARWHPPMLKVLGMLPLHGSKGRGAGLFKDL